MTSRDSGQRRQPSQQRARATRERILDAAARLFGERGISATSTNRIASEAGVSIVTVYRYFADRSVIVDAMLDRLLDTVERRFAEWVSETSAHTSAELLSAAPQRLTEMLELFVDELMNNAALVRALVGGTQYYVSGLPEFEPRLHRLVTALLVRLLGPGDDHTYTVMALVIVNTGFAAVLRSTAADVDVPIRREAVALTGQMIGIWIQTEAARRNVAVG
ncbi:TetR/AcrR family transcriptional regulator [Nocardia wallacei]|uniref:TetR/AcrR family transcriptional regulator n=1 Tax=Nocardia wallacei TaxID=480035 RepID=UPI002453E392|nr:TetR/AcrR family transcriptional regulator [Nocardia wallacei]